MSFQPVLDIYCFFKVPTWNDELKAREHLMLNILRLARDLGVEFAFPTQTVHLSKEEALSFKQVNYKQLAKEKSQAQQKAEDLAKAFPLD